MTKPLITRSTPVTPGCWICDPSAFESDEEACDRCFESFLEYVEAQEGAA